MLKAKVRLIAALTAGVCLITPILRSTGAESNSSLPAIIQTGFALWTKGGADVALTAWQKGGLMEGDSKAESQARFFKQMDLALGNFKNVEQVGHKNIGQSTQIIYLAMNFERGAVFARFLLFRSDKNWVVQNMDFSVKPEGLMPWLAFEEGKNAE